MKTMRFLLSIAVVLAVFLSTGSVSASPLGKPSQSGETMPNFILMRYPDNHDNYSEVEVYVIPAGLQGTCIIAMIDKGSSPAMQCVDKTINLNNVGQGHVQAANKLLWDGRSYDLDVWFVTIDTISCVMTLEDSPGPVIMVCK